MAVIKDCSVRDSEALAPSVTVVNKLVNTPVLAEPIGYGPIDASTADSVYMVSLTFQPTILREYTSAINAV